MPITELKGGEEPDAIIRAAFAMSHGDFDDSVKDDNDPAPEEEQPEEIEDDTTEDNVDNDEEVDDQENDEDENDEESENEEDAEEVEEEPEEGSYDSGYLYTDAELNKKVFLKFADPETGEKSIYLDRKEAERGLARQLAFIGNLKEELKETKTRYETEMANIRKDLQIYQLTAKPEQLKSAMIAEKMPEKYRSIDPKKLGEAEYDEYKTARVEAEIAVDREIRQARQDAEDASKKSAEDLDRATTHIRKRAEDSTFFGLINSEDKYIVSKRLKETPEGSQNNYYEMAISVAKAFGNVAADTFLKAIVQDVISVEEPKLETPPAKKEPPKPAKKADKVEQIQKKVKVKKVSSSSKGTDPMPANPRDIFNMAFKATKPRTRR